MLDPTVETILLAAAKSAASAVGGMAVRASEPTWKRALEKYRPANSKIRRISAWKNVQIQYADQEKIVKYLESRHCSGLLEIAAYLYAAGYESDSTEIAEIHSAFVAELSSGTSDYDQGRAAAEKIWVGVDRAVRLHVFSLKEKGIFGVEDMMFFGKIVEKPKSDERQPSRLRLVANRVDIAASHERSRKASYTVDLIRSAMSKTYENMIMPQVRDDHQIPIKDIYIDRDLRPYSDEISEGSKGNGGTGDGKGSAGQSTIVESELDDRRLVIVGNPGAGKSTFIRHLIYSISLSEGREPIAPMLLELKNYATITEPWLRSLASNLSIATQAEIDPIAIQDILILGLATVVFDGLDEVSSLEQRRNIARTIQQFARRFPLARLIVTSREEGFMGARLDSGLFPVYRLPDFTDDQVKLYAYRWFNITNRLGLYNSADRAAEFLHESMHVQDLRVNPLLLALLCAIYDYEGYIPENRPSIYAQCAELFLERWDRQRGVPMTFRSTADVRYLIQELAHHFFSRQDIQSGETELALKALIRDYIERKVTGDRSLADNQAEEFLEYCAGRAWILSRVGRNARGARLFGFTHRTFMEYFSACYLVRHHNQAESLVEQLRPIIVAGSSDVVPQIAIQEFDRRAADGIDDCLSLLVFGSRSVRTSTSVECLEFSLRSLRFIRPTPRVMTSIYVAGIKWYAKKWDPVIASQLISTPRDVHALLNTACRDMVTPPTAAENSSERAAAHAVMASIDLVADDAAFAEKMKWAIYFRQSLQDYFAGRSTELLNDDADCALEMYRNRLLRITDYVAVAGVRSLLMGSSSSHSAGPLVELLVGHGALYYEDMAAIEKYVIADTRTMIPIKQSVAEELILNVAVWSAGKHAGTDFSNRFRTVLGLVLICAASDWDRDWLQIARELEFGGGDYDEVDLVVRDVLKSRSVPSAWRKVFELWLSDDLVIGE